MSYLTCATIIVLFCVAWLKWRAVMHTRRRAQMEEASNAAAHFQRVKQMREDKPMLERLAYLQRRN